MGGGPFLSLWLEKEVRQADGGKKGFMLMVWYGKGMKGLGCKVGGGCRRFRKRLAGVELTERLSKMFSMQIWFQKQVVWIGIGMRKLGILPLSRRCLPK